MTPLVAILISLLLNTNYVSGTAGGYFLGGTMSFTCVQNNHTGKTEVRIDIITGWSLGRGPCGPNCSRSDTGSNTTYTRQLMEKIHHDPWYFGNWSIETKVPIYRNSTKYYKTTVKDITGEVRPLLKGEMVAVNEVRKWEQEHAIILLSPAPSSDDGRFDISYDGNSMPEMPLQLTHQHQRDGIWHIQAKVDTRNRSDTGLPNGNPIALVKPIYRIRLNHINTIGIAVTDPEGDIVKCALAYAAEAGVIGTHPLPGLSVGEDCMITINASSSFNYTHGMLGGVALVARDYNKQGIFVGGERHLSNMFSLSGTPVQFLVHVLENITGPEFIDPTPKRNHRYDVYVGSTWKVDVYARVEPNGRIQDFVVLRRLGETLQASNISRDYRHDVWQVTVSWTPTSVDLGSHIICVRAIDNTGLDSADDRCFILEVKQLSGTEQITILPKDKPSFVNIPSLNDTLKCDVGVTCVYPILVHSTSDIASVRAEGTFDFYTVGFITQAKTNDGAVYEVDLSILMNKAYGTRAVCLTATDVNGMSSEKVCLEIEIIPIDPCLSSPCHNSANCSRSPHDPTDYRCDCFNNNMYEYEGKNCDRKANKACDSSPCKNGARCIPHTKTMTFFCFCRGTGFTGPTCEQDEIDCKPDPCNHHGVCIDGVKNFTCKCYDRYSGEHCERDLCPIMANSERTCPGLSNTSTSQPASMCQDSPSFPCHSDFNMCSDKTIADKYCRQSCGLCGGSVQIVG